ALADAQQVPKGFVMNSSNDAAALRNYNRIYTVTKQFGFYTIPTWSQNLTTENGQVDPRAAVTLTTTRAADNKNTPIYVPNKYSSGDAGPTPIARYEEAQLIVDAIQGGAQAVAINDPLRAQAGL